MATWFENLTALAKEKPDERSDVKKDSSPGGSSSSDDVTDSQPGGESPLKDMWNVKEEPTAPPVSIASTLTPEKLTELAESQQFGQLVPKEVAEQMPPEVLNTVGQQIYKVALQHSGTLTDGLVESRMGDVRAEVAKQVKAQLVENAAMGSVQLPPEAEPVMKLVTGQIAKHNPQATPEWVAQQAQNYFMNIAAAMPSKASAQAEEGMGRRVRGGRENRVKGNPSFPDGKRVRTMEGNAPEGGWMSWAVGNE